MQATVAEVPVLGALSIGLFSFFSFLVGFLVLWTKASTTEDPKVHKGKHIAAGLGSLLPSVRHFYADYRFTDAWI
jgi:hypothetical protein